MSWYGEILGPDQRMIEKIVAHTGASVPRAGLAGGLICGFSREFGVDPDPELLRGAVVLAELANRAVVEGRQGEWMGLVHAAQHKKLLEFFRRVRVLRRTELQEIVRRLRPAGPLSPVPEGVLFVRGCLALAAVAAVIPPELHRQLDPIATWFGIRFERDVSEDCWSGIWGRAVPRRAAVDGLESVVAALPFSPFLSSLCRLQPEPISRVCEVWRPHWVPTLPLSTAPSLDALLQGPPVLVQAGQYLSRQGGKRLRPQLVCAVADAVGRSPQSEAMVEWLHILSLVLDDVLDEAPTRRGIPSLHRITDVPFAVSVAAWLAARIVEETVDSWVGEQLLAAAESLLWGEAEEFRRLGDVSLSEQNYRDIVEAKTGALFAAAARLGAWNDCPVRLVRFTNFGLRIGVAFQLIDDLLDYVGEESNLGKVPGVDLSTKKLTLPLILLRERLPNVERQQLDATIGTACLGWVVAKLHAYGVVEEIVNRARLEVQLGLDSLLPEERTLSVVAIAHRAVDRVT